MLRKNFHGIIYQILHDNDGGENQGEVWFYSSIMLTEDDGIISDFHNLFLKLIKKLM